MLAYMLDTNICIYVMKNYPEELREKFNLLAEQLCISSITLGELYYGAEKSSAAPSTLRRSRSSPQGSTFFPSATRPPRITDSFAPNSARRQALRRA